MSDTTDTTLTVRDGDAGISLPRAHWAHYAHVARDAAGYIAIAKGVLYGASGHDGFVVDNLRGLADLFETLARPR